MSQAEAELMCPYCGEWITVFVDTGGGPRQRTVSDCDVCCRPIELDIRVEVDPDTDEEIARAQGRRDSEEHF
jgi:hypothetical protein